MKVNTERVHQLCWPVTCKLKGNFQQYLSNRLKNIRVGVGFALVILTSAILLPSAHADDVFEAEPGHDETGGIGHKEGMDWHRGNDFNANHAKMGDVKVGFEKFKFRMELDQNRWLTLGAGYRGTGLWTENQAGGNQTDNYTNQYSNDNARLYLNGQIHKFLKFEVNTECFYCNNTGSGDNPKMLYSILDVIGKFEYNQYLNVWGGRMLVPTERGELSGPFFQATHDPFKTPLFPQDFSTKFGNGGAGRYGRSDGGTFWGSVEPGFIPGTLGYAAGVYSGLESKSNSGPNQRGSASWAGRLTYNFLNPENNPGYYTSSTYFGEAGDILALAFGFNYQADGAGSFANRSNFLGIVSDILFEKVMPRNMGVFTLDGEYKHFFADYNTAAFADPDCFCIFDGESWTVTGLYLIPTKIGIGQFQPYGRFTTILPDDSSNRQEVEGGINYVIDGFNARISAYYQYGDLATKGANYAPGVTGEKINVFKLSFQIQI